MVTERLRDISKFLIILPILSGNDVNRVVTKVANHEYAFIMVPCFLPNCRRDPHLLLLGKHRFWREALRAG